MRKLVADSGSTKTDWLLLENDAEPVVVKRFTTGGMNPAVFGDEALMAELQAVREQVGDVDEVLFYGAGCAGAAKERMESMLRMVIPAVTTVDSDMVGAARAVCGHHEGIACILGTGSNSCLFDGERIVANVPPLGYILGDEGSGAALGKLFLNRLFKGQLPQELKEDFLAATGLDYDIIINKVYRQPMANRFLASIAKYIGSRIDEEPLRQLVKEHFHAFFQMNVDAYRRKDLAVGAVGSIAWHFRNQLSEVAHERGYRMGCVVKAPLDVYLQD